MSSRNFVVAVIQLTSTSSKQGNREKCTELLTQAKSQGAVVAFLPEAFDFIGESSSQTRQLAERIDQTDGTVAYYSSLARKLDLSLSLGGFHELKADEDKKIYNTHVFITNQGVISGSYSKAHLFDVELPEKGVRLKESDYVVRGPELPEPVRLPLPNEEFLLGLAVCYDMRFPELSLTMRRRGAHILTFPSAFTVPTGEAGHWSSLLKARAIETQCYVIAAAQCGHHNKKRSSYGHSCIVDPWGQVLVEIPEGEGVACAEISMERIMTVRKEMPVQQHRRDDLYALAELGCAKVSVAKAEQEFDFGPVIKIPGNTVVLESRLSYVVVNRKPVLQGHLLVIPKRLVARVQGLTVDEVQDLFLTAQVAQRLVETNSASAASTISIQDGPDAGQTVPHVHIHILPRHPGDFEKNDDVYDALDRHDKGEDIQWRSYEDMAQEAKELRKFAVDKMGLAENFSI